MIPLPPIGGGSQTSRLTDEPALESHLGDLAPGDPLGDVEFAKAHKVSRTIVRAGRRDA